MNTIQKVYDKIPIFWINLGNSEDRFKKMSDQLADYACNLRVDAVDGRDPKQFVTNNQVTYTNHKNFTTATIAVICSHIKAIKKGYDMEYDMICVCEDDANFELIKYYPYTLREIIDKSPSDWDVIQLYHTEKLLEQLGDYQKVGLKVFKRDSIYSGTCYLINRKGMKKILTEIVDTDGEKTFHIKVPIKSPEDVIFSYVNTYVLNLPFIYYYGETMTFDRYTNNAKDYKICCQKIQLDAKNVLIDFLKNKIKK